MSKRKVLVQFHVNSKFHVCYFEDGQKMIEYDVDGVSHGKRRVSSVTIIDYSNLNEDEDKIRQLSREIADYNLRVVYYKQFGRDLNFFKKEIINKYDNGSN